MSNPPATLPADFFSQQQKPPDTLPADFFQKQGQQEAPQAEQPGAAERFFSGVNQSSLGTFAPPQDATEHVIEAVTGGTGAGLAAWRSAKSIVDSVQRAMEAKPNEFANAREDIKRAVQDFHNRDFRNLASDIGSIGGDVISQGGTPGAEMVGGHVRGISEGARPGADLATPLGKAAGDVATIAAPGAVEGLLGEGAAAEAAVPKPGLVKQVLQGEKVAQAPAKAAIRGAVGAEENVPILQGNKTVFDEALNKIEQSEKAAYKKIDETAGFDVKTTRKSLEENEYKLKQPEITPAARKRLTAAVDQAKQSLTKAESRFAEKDINPKEGDTLFQQRMAGEDLKKVLVSNVSADGKTVNVDGLLNGSKKLRFNDYGDRLEQFFGKDGAKKFMEDLQRAKDMGAEALDSQKLAKTIAKYAVPGAVGTGGVIYELMK